jgi:hypothetical protein
VLAKSPPLEAEEAHGVNWPNYRKNFPLEKVDSQTYPHWIWDGTARLFSPTPPELVIPELRQRSALAVKKCRALWEVIYELSALRYPVWRGLILQETVYAAKKAQAEKYKDAGYPKDALPYPYVLHYAEVSGLALRDAADEILFKARLDDETLARSELLRLKYFNLIKAAMATDELKSILDQFRSEAYGKSWFWS